jgi:Cu2+-exporting ATPase
MSPLRPLPLRRATFTKATQHRARRLQPPDPLRRKRSRSHLLAMESADVVLMKSDPYDIVAAIELSRATLRKMHQNLWWAVGYNVIAFPLAAGVLYPFVLRPEVAALSMSGSTLIVAINALMLKRTKLAGIRQPGKSAPPGAPGGSATPEPAKAPAVPAKPRPVKKAAG